MADFNNQTQPSAQNDPAVIKYSRPQHTPGPWRVSSATNWIHASVNSLGQMIEVIVCGTHNRGSDVETRANALVIAAAPALLEAARLLEIAEHNRQFCDECDGGEGEPEACEKCFPSFDDARIKRRLAIAAAVGDQTPAPASNTGA